ncbi:MAG: 50S ribosomal protein L31 [Mycoplasmoidaceae bacterium]
MKKDIHPQSKDVNFVCSSCNSEFKFKSTIKDDKFTIDVCGKCHPFYMGNLSSQQVRGRAEKFSKKFEAGKNQINSTTTKDIKSDNKKSENKKIIRSLDSL